MRRRRWFGAASALALVPLACPLLAQTRHSSALPLQVGFLNFGARPEGGVPVALRRALAELGYVEDSGVAFTTRSANFEPARLQGLCDELAALKLDVIIAFGSKAARTLTRTTQATPIVFYNAGDPVATGLVASMSAPGANVTGVSDQSAELSAKRLELLRQLVPKAAFVAVMWNADDLAMTLRYQEIERAARLLGVKLQPLGVREPEEFETAFAAMTRERPDALMLITDSLTTLNRRQVVAFAAANRIPTIYEYAYLVQEGGLISYGPDLDEMTARVASFVDRIARGARPRDLPIEQPARYDLFVNVGTARTLGLTVPQSLLLQARGTMP